MNILQKLRRKKKKLVVGLMSGTSADSADAVLAEITGFGTSTRLRQIAFTSVRYPAGYKQFLLRNSLPGTGTVDTISQLNVLVAHFLSDAVKAVVRKAKIPFSAVDLIGSHGQTVHHIPTLRNMFGKKIRSTLQIGDLSTLSVLTGIPVVGNFRTADMAVGGQGAPLVPYFDYLMFRSPKKHRLLLNIGGIANMTLLKKNCTVSDVVAFDTGPGNMVIDALMKKFYRKEFDNNGNIARSGKIILPLLRYMMRHPYLYRPLPKSTGRELFGEIFVAEIIKKSGRLKKEDVVATATEFTAMTVYHQFAKFLRPLLRRDLLNELIVSGGGAKNSWLMESLRRYFYPAQIGLSTDFGIDSNAKEALCFAVLANETIHGQPSNIPSVTGARRPVVLGECTL
ncbi:MAG: anhydro-N-acetylmuramic acid kinase [Bacteroidota bacterium]